MFIFTFSHIKFVFEHFYERLEIKSICNSAYAHQTQNISNNVTKFDINHSWRTNDKVKRNELFVKMFRDSLKTIKRRNI